MWFTSRKEKRKHGNKIKPGKIVIFTKQITAQYCKNPENGNRTRREVFEWGKIGIGTKNAPEKKKRNQAKEASYKSIYKNPPNQTEN